MTRTPHTLYQELIASGVLQEDPEQLRTVQELTRLFEETLVWNSAFKPNFLHRMAGIGTAPDPKGIYIYGGVGRGKSMLMDMFYDALPDDVRKRRVHFHEFMIEVHDYVHSRAMDGSVKGMVDQALPSLSSLIARKSNVLCFDEFHVTDIADAMILGRLFRILFEKGVVIVATSNWAPDDLYKDGLQRDRFLPFIELLKSKVEVVHLDSPTDYRAETTQIEGTYFTPLGGGTKRTLDSIFDRMRNGTMPKKDTITVKGRKIIADEAVDGVARFSFSQLCERPLGAEDYLKIAKKYDTVFVEGIPRLGYDRRNEAKRLMSLVDALYEQRTRVIISAAVEAEDLYHGHDHSFEFERTVSRLLEMQSNEYP